MAKISAEESRAKKDKFIEEYLRCGNASEAARAVGTAPNRATQRGYELKNDTYVKEKLRTYQQIEKDTATDSVGSTADIFDSIGPQALSLLAKKALTDPIAAEKFYKLKQADDRKKSEELGDYAGFSTKELLDEFDNIVKEGKETKDRIMEALRAGEMQD